MYKNEKGFSVVEILLVLVILGTVLGVGYFVYNSRKVIDNNTAEMPQQMTNPYDGWKKDCIASDSFCFLHPINWTKQDTTSPSEIPEISINSSSEVNDGSVVYGGHQSTDCANVPHPDNNTTTFTVTSIEDVENTDLNLKVVGGYAVYSEDYQTKPFTYSPSYFLINSSLVDTYELKVGNSSTYSPWFLYETCFDFDSISGYAKSEPISNPSRATEEEAKAWLNSTEAKTGALILRSIQ